MNSSKTGVARPVWRAAGLLLAWGVTCSALTFAGEEEKDKRHEQPPPHNAAPAQPQRAQEPQRAPAQNFQRPPNEGGSRPPATNFQRPPNEGGARAPGETSQRPSNQGGGSRPPATNFQRPPNEGGARAPGETSQRPSNQGGGSRPPATNFQRPPNEGGARAPGETFQRPSNEGGSRPSGNFQHGSPGVPGGPRPGPGGFAGGGHAPTPSRTFVGHPTPAGGREFHASNGNVVRMRPGGGWADIHDPHRGMDIHRGLNGSRVVIVDRPDHSRIFVAHGGYGYVQHPYVFRGHEFAQRTYWVGGHPYARFYQRYPYHGVYLEVYAPARFYPVGFYGWAYRPWGRPVPYGWGWSAYPWYGHYGFYFSPYPVYAGPAFWLTDYLIATSLQAAYAQQPNVQYVAEPSGLVLTPDVKAQIADEVKYDVEQENMAAQANMNNPQAPPPDTSVGMLLSDGRPHVFVAGAGLDLVDAYGNECMITEGDVVQVQSPAPSDSGQVNAIVLASKGGNECARTDTVAIALADLQEMQNHMRETIDQGMADLQAKQGQGGLPPAPQGDVGPAASAGFAQDAPPPDPNAQSELNAQANAANQVEEQNANAAPAEGSAGDGGSAQGGAPPTISLGQTPDQVRAAVGEPTRIINLGPKYIYIYPDMKVIFENGVVSDVQ